MFDQQGLLTNRLKTQTHRRFKQFLLILAQQEIHWTTITELGQPKA
jgi:hypothetical protein